MHRGYPRGWLKRAWRGDQTLTVPHYNLVALCRLVDDVPLAAVYLSIDRDVAWSRLFVATASGGWASDVTWS